VILRVKHSFVHTSPQTHAQQATEPVFKSPISAGMEMKKP
jgi:hypothetical protein